MSKLFVVRYRYERGVCELRKAYADEAQAQAIARSLIGEGWLAWVVER